jgi:hypothetical protein
VKLFWESDAHITIENCVKQKSRPRNKIRKIKRTLRLQGKDLSHVEGSGATDSIMTLIYFEKQIEKSKWPDYFFVVRVCT